MLRPEEMTRAVVVGSIDSLDVTIECLYELGVLHMIDFTKQDEDFKLGQPLPQASDDSKKLLKLRSMMRALEIEEHRPEDRLHVSHIETKMEQALVTLDLNTTSKAEARQRIQALIREKESEIRALTPFKGFGIPVEYFEGYDNILTFAGTCKTDPSGAIFAKIGEIEIFKEISKRAVAIAIFARNEDKAEVARILSEHNFQEVKLPKLKGDPQKIIDTNISQIKDLEADLRRIEGDMESIRNQFADFIISSEEHLAIEVLKAETPLRIATSANSFVIDGWIPTSRLDEIQTGLDSLCCGLAFVETVPSGKEEEPPVKLRNPRPVKPFEFFINLVSTPKYEEIDPTIILFITFPLFFGFMIGDLGFGLSLFALGALIRWKFKSSPDLYKLGAIILAGGFMASVFGMFVFAEAFGVPFHPPEENADEHSWEVIANIPIHPLLDKMRDSMEMIAISLVAGWIHLTVGFAFGFVNHYPHSKKHALGKIAWLLVLFGLFAEMMVIAGDATQTSHFMNSTVLSPIPDISADVIGIKVSMPSLGLIVAGVLGIVVFEGAMALTEVVGVFTNLVSYARLAAMAIGKGAVAVAFNFMLFPMIFESGNVVVAILGVVALFVSQAFFVFFIGALSSGIQAIRLNYVEFFLKFFEGGGTEFSPLSYERKYSVTTK
jgi:V/A-type H+-transporting ATPase subunit I